MRNSKELRRIRPRMEVVSSCGCRLGTVDRLDGRVIKLVGGNGPGEPDHYVPGAWVARVGERVHLSKTADETRAAWAADLSEAEV